MRKASTVYAFQVVKGTDAVLVKYITSEESGILCYRVTMPSNRPVGVLSLKVYPDGALSLPQQQNGVPLFGTSR